MKRWLFNIITKPVLFGISKLPFFILFGISDFFFILVYYIIRYRRKVVSLNLKNSFPEKSENELALIQKKFYKHFCDLILEVLKTLTISKKEFNERCVYSPNAHKIFDHYEKLNKGFICVSSHCGNWEWTSIGHQIYFKTIITGIYHPLSNVFFDKLIYEMRSRFGGNMVPMNLTLREILEQKRKGIVSNLGLIADQTPPAESAYWTTFLNQDTPVFNGVEKIAKKFNYPVVFISMHKLARGKYIVDADVLVDSPANTKEGEISEIHTKFLEQKILEQPEFWLWTHRRWKHKRPH